MEQSTKLLLPHHMWALAFSNIIACSFIGELANLQLQINKLKKTEVRYFTVQTEQARSINCLLYGYSILPVAAAILHL